VHFVCAGHLLPNKGQLELVEACAEVRRPYSLSLAGDTTRDKRYAAQVQRVAAALGDHVKLLGPLTAAELAALYHRADIFVSASLYESYGIAVAEALSCGLPVLSWSKGGLWEFLSDGENAIRVPQTAKAALVSAMISLCEDAKLRTRLQRGAIRSMSALRSWRDTAAQVEELLRST
jgi:glycosyltransferase involved in cell wall biosynthesis